MIRLIFQLILTVFFLTSASAADPIKILEVKTYRVKMNTRLKVPARAGIDQIRVWHALPTLRPWSQNSIEIGAKDILNSPSTGKAEYHAPTNSHHILWDQMGSIRPGQSLSFTTEFTVRSARRTLDMDLAKIAWSDLKNIPSDQKPIQTNDLPSDLLKKIDDVKSKKDPVASLLDLSDWIKKNIIYDASVTFSPEDTFSTWTKKRGHCGHFYYLFEKISKQLGIPVRMAMGLNLYSTDGLTGGLQAIRADFTNIHTWGEIYLPKMGWVEVEPSQGNDLFNIPARYIQNNRWFQNYSIWIRENGEQRPVTWTIKDGAYVSEFAVENIVSYQEL